MRTSDRLSVAIIVVAVLQVAGLAVSLVAGHTLVGHLFAGLVVIMVPVPVTLYRAYRLARAEGR